MFRTPPGQSEHVTRKKLIDLALKAAGWTIVPFDSRKPLTKYERCAVEEYPTESGPADYALCVGGQILGVVEAKKLSLGPQNVLTQAERYSKGVMDSAFDFRGYRVPFLYSTNGEVIWHHDIGHELNLSRQVAGFNTPEALQEFLSRDLEAAAARVQKMPNDHSRIVARPYQVEANTEIEKAIAAHKRYMLVAMATGTGKTFMTVNEIYRLMKSGVAKRILFLVDRRALAAQAVRTFATFEPEPGLKFNKIYEVYRQRFQREDFDESEKFDPTVLPAAYLQKPKPGSAFVYVSTIQRMAINLFGRDAVFGDGDEPIEDDAAEIENIPIHAFDLVIADECHRGYTAKQLSLWRQTLEHFDAIKIGLTLAERKQLISRSPFMQVEFLKQGNPRPPHIVTFEEEERILTVAVPYIRVLVALILETGMRSHREALALKWDAIEFVNDFIRVRESKTRAGIRNVPLSARCKTELLRWRDVLGPEFSSFVFPNMRTPTTPMKDIRQAWAKALKEAGLETLLPLPPSAFVFESFKRRWGI